jgi:hypothetical protein
MVAPNNFPTRCSCRIVARYPGGFRISQFGVVAAIDHLWTLKRHSFRSNQWFGPETVQPVPEDYEEIVAVGAAIEPASRISPCSPHNTPKVLCVVLRKCGVERPRLFVPRQAETCEARRRRLR